MKIGNIVSTNPKGQIVIPAAIRAQLGISDQVPLQLLVKGNALYVVPIRDVITVTESDNSYLDALKKTQGAWKEDVDSTMIRKKMELESSSKRKQKW